MSYQSYHERLTAFFTKYDPSKLNEVDNMLAGRSGREEKLMQTLISAYGPEPSGRHYPPPPPAQPSWIKQLGDKHGIIIQNSDVNFLKQNGINEDTFFNLTELNCNTLLNTPQNVKMAFWQIIQRESGRMSEVETLRSANIELRNEVDRLKLELQRREAEISKLQQ